MSPADENAFISAAQGPKDLIDVFDLHLEQTSVDSQLHGDSFFEHLPLIDFEVAQRSSGACFVDSPGLDLTSEPLADLTSCLSLPDAGYWNPSSPSEFELSSVTDHNSSEWTTRRMTRSSSTTPSDSSSSDGSLGDLKSLSQQREQPPSNSEPNMHSCVECSASFLRVSAVEDHARSTRHKPFVCPQCNKRFSRRDAWTRHRDLHNSQGQYPCPRCTKYQGADAFRRRDHLRQHLRKFHRVHPNTEFPRFCTFDSCRLSAEYDPFKGFEQRKNYTKHMREAHGKETYDCMIDGCERFGKKGFARLNDLERHRKLAHPNVGELDVVELRCKDRY